MKIVNRINYTILLMVLLVLTTAGIFSYSRAYLNKLSSEHLKNTDDLHHVEYAGILFLRLENKHLNFFRTYKLESLTGFEKDFEELLNSLKILKRSAFIDHDLDYQGLFESTVAQMKTLGLDENSGLRGEFRQQVHMLEKALIEKGNQKFLVSMLMLRRHEKDFILRRNQSYLDKHQESLVKLSSLLKNESKLLAFLGNYNKVFNKYSQGLISLASNIETQRALEVKLHHELEATQQIYQKDLVSYTQNLEERTQGHNQFMLALISIVGVAAFVVLWLMRKNIVGDLSYLKKIMLSLASGEKSDFELSHKYDEVGQIINLANESVDKFAAMEKESLQQARDELLSNMNHEMRTPLNGLMLSSELLNDSELTKDQKQYVTAIKDTSERMLELIDDMLNFDLLQKGQVDVVLDECSFKSSVMKMQEYLNLEAKKKQLSCSVVAKSLPVSANFDCEKYEQIIKQLISNAVKFTEKGNVALEVVCEGNMLVTKVVDTGVGLSEASCDKIFDCFIQEDISITKSFSGTGLGLSIAKTLVDLLKGEITVKSELGKGSCFTVSLPLNNPQGSFTVKDVVEKKAADSKENFPYSVLVVEDNRTNQLVTCKALEKLGCTMDKAFNGVEAVKLAHEKQYDLILMDIQMPVMDGLTATQKIRSVDGPNVDSPIIALTANVEPTTRSKCEECEMNGFLTKPISRKVLIKVLRLLKSNELSWQKFD